jgi:hypothetical protein
VDCINVLAGAYFYCLGPFGVNYERAQAIDFTFAIGTDYYTTIVPIQLTKDPWPIIRPFDPEVWLGILVTLPIFLAAIGITSFIFFEKSIYHRNKSWMFTLRTVFIQSSCWIPEEAIHQKVLALTWIWACFILAQGYAGTAGSCKNVWMLLNDKCVYPYRPPDSNSYKSISLYANQQY